MKSPEYYCTLFGSNYLYKGIALYRSMIRHCGNFRLYILCMDETTHALLRRMHLRKAVLIPLNEFENSKLKSVKKTRTFGEYCWTCTPSLPLYILTKYPSAKRVSYVDSDLYFFGSPQPIFDECEKKSVMIIPHRHPPQYQYLVQKHGLYNVGMLTFKNDGYAVAALKYWQNKCYEWCYARSEYGLYGDQGYLNAFPHFLGKHLCVLQNIGADLAPWNISNYHIRRSDKRVYVDSVPLIFYHFATMVIGDKGRFLPLPKKTLFSLSPHNHELIYKPYYKELSGILRFVRRLEPGFIHNLISAQREYRSVTTIGSRVKYFFKHNRCVYALYTYYKKRRLYAGRDNIKSSKYFRIILPVSRTPALHWVNRTLPFLAKNTYTLLRGRDTAYKQYLFVVDGLRSAISCVSGSCIVYFSNGRGQQSLVLDAGVGTLLPRRGIRFWLSNFSGNCVLLVYTDRRLTVVSEQEDNTNTVYAMKYMTRRV